MPYDDDRAHRMHHDDDHKRQMHHDDDQERRVRVRGGKHVRAAKQLAAEFKEGTLIARLDTTKGLAEYFEWSVRMHSGVYHSHGAGAAVAMFANK